MFIIDIIFKLAFFFYILPIAIVIVGIFIILFWQYILIGFAVAVVVALFQLRSKNEKSPLTGLELQEKLDKEMQRSLLVQRKIDEYKQAHLYEEPEPLIKATGTATFTPYNGGEEQKIDINIVIK